MTISINDQSFPLTTYQIVLKLILINIDEVHNIDGHKYDAKYEL